MSRHFSKQPVMVVHEATTLISSYINEMDVIENSGKRSGVPKINARKKSNTNNTEYTVVAKTCQSPGNSPVINRGVSNMNSNSAFSKVFKMTYVS